MSVAATPRMRHYGTFYGIDPLPEDDGRPLAVVVGNCQAESMRVLLGDGPSSSLRTVRVPPVFELERDDLPHLARVLASVDILVAQPVRDDYRGLPLGTEQLRRGLPPAARVVLFPSMWYSGLYPTHAVVGSGPSGQAGDPPLVPYHDLATALVAVGGSLGPMTGEGIRRAAAASLEELVSRERRHQTVAASDLVTSAGVDAAHTINHPGNTVLIGVARRVEERLGLPVTAADPGRTLLRSVLAPLAPDVLAALGLPPSAVRPDWTVEGEAVPAEVLAERHLRWYAEHPGVAEHVLATHADTVRLLREGV